MHKNTSALYNPKPGERINPLLDALGQDRFLYRAVDKEGNTVEFLLTAHRDRNAARRFLEKAMKSNEEPSLINIDKSGANTAGIKDYNDTHSSDIEIRQCKYPCVIGIHTTNVIENSPRLTY